MNEQKSREAQIGHIDYVVRELAWHAQKQVMRTLVRPDVNLTMPQVVTMFAIRDSGVCRMSVLADTTQQSAGTLTGIVDRLIAEGLVMRTRNDNDRRVVEVMLTPEGEARLRLVSDARAQDMHRILERFPDRDLVQFERMLRTLLNGIHGDIDDINTDGTLERSVGA